MLHLYCLSWIVSSWWSNSCWDVGSGVMSSSDKTALIREHFLYKQLLVIYHLLLKLHRFGWLMKHLTLDTEYKFCVWNDSITWHPCMKMTIGYHLFLNLTNHAMILVMQNRQVFICSAVWSKTTHLYHGDEHFLFIIVIIITICSALFRIVHLCCKYDLCVFIHCHLCVWIWHQINQLLDVDLLFCGEYLNYGGSWKHA